MLTRQTSWGRLNHELHQLIPLYSPVTAVSTISQKGSLGLAYGMGRSYGDSCLNPGNRLWSTRHLDHLIAFDTQTGYLKCEAGMLLKDIQRIAVPQGWMLPVSPGTQWVTVGGAIANDVHGKNHYRSGSFGHHVKSLLLARTDGQLIHCSEQDNSDWFVATIGGLGLTGVMLHAEIQLQPVNSAYLQVEHIPYRTLGEFFQIADHSQANWAYRVAWIDCLSRDGKGIFIRGNHVDQGLDLPSQYRKKSVLSMPFAPPISLVNRLSLKPFNDVYYYLQKQKVAPFMMHYEPFFYPLDAILHWNRMYGTKGFYQYQAVVPSDCAQEAIQSMLQWTAHHHAGSFLAVIKQFGDIEAAGLLSFPMPGVTLALDFPNQGARTLALFNELDAIVGEVNGRIYVAKDARMPRDLFEKGYPNISEFLAYRDPGISSALSRRLMDEANG